MTYRRRRVSLAQRLLMGLLIQAMAVAFAGLSVVLFWLLLTVWPMEYDNIPLVLWAIGWVEHSLLVDAMRDEARREGLL